MIDWQKILWDLKRDYKHLAKIARDIDCSRQMLQKIARGGKKNDVAYSIGVKLLKLHNKFCKHRDAE